jgi:hypothetical protein
MAIESVSTDRSPTTEALLRDLGGRGSSGVLEIAHPGEEVSHVWVRDGRVYAMQVPGYRPALGIRLLSGGLVSPEQLSAAAAEQRERFPTHLIGQVLVALGYVQPEVIDAFVHEQVLDQLADLLDLPVEDAAFHPGRRISHDVISPTEVEDLLSVAHQRRGQRADVLAAVGGAHVVPVLGPPPQGAAQTPLGPYDWALLCRVDGRRDITELARVCGFTVQEAAQMVHDLSLTGLLALPHPVVEPDAPLAAVVALRPAAPASPPDPPQWQFDGTTAGEPEPVGELLAELSAFVRDEPADHPALDPPAPPDAPAVEAPGAAQPQMVAAAVATLTHDHGGSAVAALPETPTPPTPSAALPAEQRPTPPAPPPVAARTPGEPPEAAAPEPAGYSDTSVFMRELSSLSDDPQAEAPVVTRLVVPLTEQRRKRRFWLR